MEYHQNQFEDFSLLIFKNDKLIAILPANKVDNAVYSHQGLTYGGLVFSKSIKFEVVLYVFKNLLLYLQENEISKLILKQLPTIYTNLPNDELQYLSFIVKAKLLRRDVLSSIYLNSSLKITSNRLEGFKKAKNFQLVIKEESNFDAFWNEILIPNLQTKYKVNPLHNLEEITLLKNRFPNNIRQFNVYYENTIVAGTTIFETKHVAHAQYISANETKNQLGSLDYLFVYLLSEVFKNKSVFDFGVSNENQGLHINKGLQFWKEGFGARSVTQDFYEIETKNHKHLDTVFI
jgi:hypothetical protein